MIKALPPPTVPLHRIVVNAPSRLGTFTLKELSSLQCDCLHSEGLVPGKGVEHDQEKPVGCTSWSTGSGRAHRELGASTNCTAFPQHFFHAMIAESRLLVYSRETQ